ncbi:hypothetical protein Tco_0518103 [Tanacetum coccineum]
MGDENPIHTLRDYSKPSHEGYKNTIELPLGNNVIIDGNVKGVTTRGGKTTTQDVHDNDTNVQPKEPVEVEPEKPAGSDEVLTNDQPQITSKPVVQTSKRKMRLNKRSFWKI